jgi:hypothetical protein
VKHPDAIFAVVDTEKQTEIAQEAEIEGVPAFVFWQKGEKSIPFMERTWTSWKLPSANTYNTYHKTMFWGFGGDKCYGHQNGKMMGWL